MTKSSKNLPPNVREHELAQNDTTQSVQPMNKCIFIVGIPDSSVPFFVSLANKAFGCERPSDSCSVICGTMVEYSGVIWDDQNENIMQMMSYLRLLGEAGFPVAYVRQGCNVEFFENTEGFRYSFHRHFGWNPIRQGIEIIPDDEMENTDYIPFLV